MIVLNTHTTMVSIASPKLRYNSMNNLSSYCGLVDARINASDKDLPVVDTKLLKVLKLR